MNRLIVRKNHGFTLIELMIVVTILGILAVIAIPNFMKFQTRAKQGEAKANLKAWFTAQRAYFEENNMYSEQVLTVGFLPERGNRYAYYFGMSRTCIIRTASGEFFTTGANCITVDQAAYEGTAQPQPSSPYGAAYTGAGADPGMPGLGGCTGGNCNISGFAAGNLDDDTADIDTWWISTKDTISIMAHCGNDEFQSIAGEPFLSYSDVDCDSPTATP